MMVKRNITYEDLDGNPVTSEWYFSLGQTDIVEMDLAHHEDVAEYLNEIIKTKNSRELLAVWKELLFRSVGKREGNLIDKSEAVLREFRFSGAYEQFFSELVSSEDGGASFFTSIMPQSVQDKIAEERDKMYSKDELLAMSDEEFDKAAGTDLRLMSKEQMQIAFQRRGAEAA